MATNSSIEWTDATWNPVTGCSKVSPGCAHCYAEGVAGRFWANQYVHSTTRGFIPVKAYAGDALDGRVRAFTDVMCHEDRLDQPLHWRKPRQIFVNSMSDLFHEDVPDAFIERVFSVMGLAERHTFQVLTKRPERMLAWFKARRFDVKGAAILQTESGECHYAMPWPLPNVWLGVSVENQRFADERIPLLLQTPAAVRFISAEPLLGPIEFSDVSQRADVISQLGQKALNGIEWVIVGGESGHGARPFDIAWARSIVKQCRAAGVPVFLKQLGAMPMMDGIAPDGSSLPARGGSQFGLRDRKGGDPAEWPEDLRVRQFPEVRA